MTHKESKGQRTKQEIVEAAMTLFAEIGYEKATIREIAKRAGVSPGLAYRYFSGKEDLALALYGELAKQFAGRSDELPAGTVAERFAAAMRIKIEVIEPHRQALSAILASASSGAHRLSAMGRHTEGVRQTNISVFDNVVEGAKNAPKKA